MRVNPNMVPDMLAALNTSDANLQTALQQVSTGKSVNVPSDNPIASAAMVQNTMESGAVDQYTQNITSVLAQVQTADSSLSSVVSSLTQAVSLGTQGANGGLSAADQQALATQVQGLLTSVVAQANMTYQGTYLFAGTANSQQPFAADSSSSTGYTYNGNSDTNSVPIGDNLNVEVNVPGSQIFTNSSGNVISALSSLATALQSGTSSDISTATTAVTAALNTVNSQRVVYSNAETQMNSQETYLQQETVNLSSQATSLVGVNLATAATNLSQAETDNSAALAAAAKVIPQTLMSFLATPS
jgi:flagellar hook-associated protein 3 FlgL